MSKKVDIEGISAEISAALGGYSSRVRDVTKRNVDEVSSELVENLKRDSPVGSRTKKKYRDGWAKKEAFENANAKRVTVYNKTNGYLTSFLENGHKKARGGGRTRARPHIRANELKAIKDLERRTEQAVKNEA